MAKTPCFSFLEMDFHSLARKELQALSKKNKIPANMTNIAMADALKALEKVEGLDEFINAPEVDPHQSPEKTMPGSPDIPQTQCRTSTRRKAINVEPESSQTLTRTRRTTRRTVTGEADPENKTVNLPETPAMPTSRRRVPARQKTETKVRASGEDEKVGQTIETPAMQSSRRRAPAVSAQRKMEPQEEQSVQRVYSTRRSVRLLEKSMAELSLRDKGRIDHVKIDGLCKEIEELEEKKDKSGADVVTISEESLETTNDSEIISHQNLNQLLENESEIKHELQEDKKSDDSEVVDCNSKLEISSEKYDNSEVLSCQNLLENENEANNELQEDNQNEDNDDSLNEADLLQVENLEKAVDMNHESIDENGPDVLATENSDTSDAALKSEIEEELISGSPDFIMKTEQPSNDKVLDDVPAEVMEHVLATPVSPPHGLNSLVNPEEFVGKIAKVILTEDKQHGNQVSEMVSLAGPDVLVTENSDASDAASKSEIEGELISGSSDFIMETEQASSNKVLDDVPAEVMEHVLATPVSPPHGINSLVDLKESVGKISEVISTEDKQHGNQGLQSKIAIEEESDGRQSDEIQKNDRAYTVQRKNPILYEDFCYEKSESRNESEKSPQSILQHEKCKEVSDDLVTKSHATNNLPDDHFEDHSVEYNLEALVDVDVVEAEEFDIIASEGHTSWDSPSMASDSEIAGKIPLSEMNEPDNSEMLVDVHVMAAEEFAMVSDKYPPALDKSNPTSMKQKCHDQQQYLAAGGGKVTGGIVMSPFTAEEFAMVSDKYPPTLDKSTPTSIKQKCHDQQQYLAAAGGKVTGGIVMSPFTADTIQGQFPRPKELTPREPSIQKMMIHASDIINKENIDTSRRIVEPKNDKAKKNEAISYDDSSLRMLRKMLKEKLQISNKNNEENNNNVMKVGTTRQALQTLPENRMQAAEPETGN